MSLLRFAASRQLRTLGARPFSSSRLLQNTEPEHPPHPEGRSFESTEVLRARLLYNSRKRGILETDLLLSTFADKYLKDMNDTELREYDLLLTLPDWTLFYWSTGKQEPDPEWANSELLAKIKEHSMNRAREIRRMPELSK